MKIVLLFLCILFSSCEKNEPKNITSSIYNSVDNFSTNTEIKNKNNQENIIINENIGIFLPEYYIEVLNKKKSHVQAAKEYYKLSKNDNNITRKNY